MILVENEEVAGIEHDTYPLTIPVWIRFLPFMRNEYMDDFPAGQLDPVLGVIAKK